MNKLLLLLCLLFCTPALAAEPQTPNVIYLMLDEWGYFESGHMGNRDLLTPNIDRFAQEGMRFTNAIAGAPVCGPTRCVLLTGLHSGHTSMRVNDGFSPIREDEPTLASMLKKRGYAAGGFGKWGIGGRGTSGVPEKHGFDEFFGYYDQVHAHTFYPRYLIRNSRALLQELDLDDNTVFFLCGDNGGQDYFKTPDRPHGFFGPNLNPKTGQRFRAGKGSLYDGGLKVPFLVRWPERIKAASVSDHVLCFQDVMPTLAELTKATCPETDGLSFLPMLLDKPGQQMHSYLYWEFAGQTAVRMKQWKAYKGKKGDWELYDLLNDVEEKLDVATDHPEILKQLIAYAEDAREPLKPGEIYNRELTEKDHRQAPHARNRKSSKRSE